MAWASVTETGSSGAGSIRDSKLDPDVAADSADDARQVLPPAAVEDGDFVAGRDAQHPGEVLRLVARRATVSSPASSEGAKKRCTGANYRGSAAFALRASAPEGRAGFVGDPLGCGPIALHCARRTEELLMRLLSLKACCVIGVVAVVALPTLKGSSYVTFVSAQQPPAPPAAPAPDGGPFTGSGPGGGARQDPGQNLMAIPTG